MGVPIAPVVDLAMCVLFHICTVNNGYTNQRMKLCSEGGYVQPEQNCPKADKQQTTAVPSSPVPQAQPQPGQTEAESPDHD